MPRRSTVVHVAESQVMGRNAIAVVVVALQFVAAGQLTGMAQASETLDGLGVPHLATLWAVAMVVAGATMIASYAVRDPADSRVWEMGANAIVAIVAATHAVAVLNGIGWSGSLWATSIDAALVVNCLGRSWFLGRQIWFVSRRADKALP